MQEKEFVLSSLGHTWILDLDGTIVKHNGYKLDGKDTFLEGAESFLKKIPREDMIIFLTSRSEALKHQTECFLKEHGISYDHIIYNAPYGERILLNDKKPSGLHTAIAIEGERDKFPMMELVINEEL